MKYAIYCLFLLLPSLLYADSVADPSDPINNDITYILPNEHDNAYGYHIRRLISYTVGTGNTNIYNDGAGSSSSAGAIKIRGMTNKTVQIDITNMNDGGTNTISFYMANGTTTPTLWSFVSESVFYGTTTSAGSTTSFVSLSQMGDYIRVGIKRSGTSSADFTVKESYNREVKN